jgi:hypothetical protein
MGWLLKVRISLEVHMNVYPEGLPYNAIATVISTSMVTS